MLEEEREGPVLAPVREERGDYALQFELTPAQKEIAFRCVEALRETDVLLHCVCGAGKTELVTPAIGAMLNEGKKVCFAIPRRQVVLELRERLARYFPKASVVAVCGGYTSETDGDLIICTTHQLFRYYQAFDLLILDEPDAFPFRGNSVLHGIAATAVRGRTVWLTATPDDTLRARVKEGSLMPLTLNRRPHGHDLPVPRLLTAPTPVLFLVLLRWLKTHRRPRMVFVPTIREAKILHRLLSLFLSCRLCTSKTEGRDDVIRAFREEPAGVMICTTVMERGVTVPRVEICVFHADHAVFDEAGLVQMAGRAGRSPACPDGDVLFLLKEKSRLAVRCRTAILEANRCAV
jgi:competence protein ComFA